MKQLLILIFSLVGLLIHAQPPSKFYTRIGGNGYDYGYDVKQTLDGGYIITGSTSSFGKGNTDVYLLKIDSMGQVNFQTSFGGANNESGKAVVQLVDSSYVIAGYTSSLGLGGYDIYVIKADKTGALIWQKTFGNAEWDFCNSMQATTDGGFILAGSTNSFGYGQADGYVIKLDGNGTEKWHKNFGGLENDEFKSVIQTADGGYLLAGQTKSYTDVNGDAWLFKLDMNGDSLWSKYYGGAKEDYFSGVIQLMDSNFGISGGTKSSSVNGNFETVLAKYDINGNVLFLSADPSTQTEYYNGLAQGLNGNIAHCGLTKNSVFGNDALVDIASAGYGYVNFFSGGSTSSEEFFAISKTKDKGFIAVGKTNGFDGVLDDVYIMKMDSVGRYEYSLVGINEQTNLSNNIELYPNPASNYITLDLGMFENIEFLTYKTLSIDGRELFSDEIKNQKTKIEVSKYNNGFYFIQISDKKNVLITKKIIISN